MKPFFRHSIFKPIALMGVCLLVAACSGPSRPKPADIPAVQVLQDIRLKWTADVGAIDYPMVLNVQSNRVAFANSKGQVSLLDAQTGKDLWRVALNTAVSAGVGTDGQQVALVTRDNQLVALKDGQVMWRQTLPAQSFTAPLVAGARVFVLTADRVVMAFDGASGRPMWTQQRTGEPLVLKQAGVLMAFKNTLLVGLSGRLVALNPDTGVVRWENAVATPRGVNDMERLVDMVAPATRAGDVVCVRAFQSQVGCVNAEKGQLIWNRSAPGERGISGNDTLMVSNLSNGVVQAWNRANGDRLWETERLKYRVLSAPLVTPRGILVADNGGFLYLLSLADGALLNRVKLAGDELAAAPLAADKLVVTVTKEGRVSGYELP
ncbi:MAG: outer membrane protein assembly factor BamB [Betaproteobacteria bacterium]|nr:outer membrane protein assembly factor BamB [Betaproteobacteria bacterium]